MIKQLMLSFVILVCCTSVYSQELMTSLDNIKDHISGNKILSPAELTIEQSKIEANVSNFENDEEIIASAFEVVSLHDNIYGALFTSGTSTEGGINPRTASGYELEKVIGVIMQAILDYSYTEYNLKTYPSLFDNVKFETSDFFPGAVSPPADKNVSYTVKINGKHVRNWGTPANYETMDARRPTGCYLAPGSVATVTVPASLVGIGASILVGAHTWDHTAKPNMKRMDRVTKQYEITDETVTIANPLGGGIYINVPFENDLGIINIILKNVVRSPYYANTVANKTSVMEWQNIERLHDAPWTDFESDKVMMQVPTSWIYNMNDPSTMMDDWDMAMDAISDLLGRPYIRSKTVVYSQVDVQIRGVANFPGYPQANVTYNPLVDYGGNHNHYLVRGPRDDRSNALTVFFHELGHAEKIYKFAGEIEAFVNFLWVSVYNKKFGVELDQAFNESSTTNVKHTIDEAAISWMIAQNFREGNPMSTTTGQFRQEFAYQPRGYAKYADIVRLFGWEVLEEFYYNLNESYENGTYTYTGNVNTEPTDDRILRMSNAAGFDLRPLLHFWGKHPDEFVDLANAIEVNGLKKSVAIYDQLMYYKTIVPMSNEAFRAFGLKDFSESSILNHSTEFFGNVDQSYYQGFLKKYWDTYQAAEGQAAVDEIQNIIDLYFPDGRPGETQTLELKVFLQGPLESGNATPLMRDDLRAREFIPLTTPYNLENGYPVVNDNDNDINENVLNTTGNNAIVDWVFVSIHNTTNFNVEATRSALLQRDGDVVDLDGISPLEINLASDDYYISINHRNHLGVMTESPITINGNATFDFTNTSDENTYGIASQSATNNVWALWSGDTSDDKTIIFQGVENDPNIMFFDVLNDPLNTAFFVNHIANGYYNSDLNLDGDVIYQGEKSDVNTIFFNILNYPLNIDNKTNFTINEQIPD